MSDGVKVIKDINQLNEFSNNKGLIEIAIRQSDSKFKHFQKIAISNQSQNEMTEVTQKLIGMFEENTAIANSNLQVLTSLTTISNIGLALNAVNLCATCAGFAVMNRKLNNMSSSINLGISMINQLAYRSKAYDKKQFDEVLGKYEDMLDRRRIQKPYSEREMHSLVEKIIVTIKFFAETWDAGDLTYADTFINVIYSLLAMLTVSLKYYDEQYYFENREELEGQENVFHNSHERWMSIYDALSSEKFVERIQDYAIFQKNMSTKEADVYYSELLSQVYDMREEVEDNQKMILAIDDVEKLSDFRNKIDQLFKTRVQAEMDKAFENDDSSEAKIARVYVLEQLSVA